MELREWAISILGASTLEGKLFTPDKLTDQFPGAPLCWDTPTRPPGMHFQKRTKKEKLPKFDLLHRPENVAMCLHRFAGHELLAVEIMAYALLAFPEAPKSFRKGLAHTLIEEQEHVQIYRERLMQMGVTFGDFALYKHFWMHVHYLNSPLEYTSFMSLTLEMANLDFAPQYSQFFAKHGDFTSSALMDRIYTDEIGHVAFGYSWLRKLQETGEDSFLVWQKSLPPKMIATRAKGLIFNREGRQMAGIPKSWIDRLEGLNLSNTANLFGNPVYLEKTFETTCKSIS